MIPHCTVDWTSSYPSTNYLLIGSDWWDIQNGLDRLDCWPEHLEWPYPASGFWAKLTPFPNLFGFHHRLFSECIVRNHCDFVFSRSCNVCPHRTCLGCWYDLAGQQDISVDLVSGMYSYILMDRWNWKTTGLRLKFWHIFWNEICLMYI